MAAVIAAGAMSSCSDPSLDYPGEEAGSRIRFDVRENSGWNNIVPAGRSAATRVSTVNELTGPSVSLYLIGTPTATVSTHASRGTSVTSETIDNFGVYAAMTDGTDQGTDGLQADYMNNVEVTREGGWSPAQEYMWPGEGKLHINAFSPYTPAAGEEGVIALPGTDETGGLSLGYRVPLDVSSQQDLLWATPVDASSSPCTLDFNHALTSIVFVAGAELSPCTVKTIAISGVMGEGTLNIESGEWTGLTDPETFTAQPDRALTAAEGSQYVEAGTAITSDGETFMMIPQTLPDGATISLTIETGGETTTLTADMSGAEWLPGTTVRYRISATASGENPHLILTVTDDDGNAVSTLTAPYNGATFSYHIDSRYDSGNDSIENIEWEAQLLDASGNVLTTLPDWIRSYDKEGKGTTDCKLISRLTVPTFIEMNEHTKVLREAQDINLSSGQDPYNLAGTDGAAAVTNTANSYIINAPGHYSLPLVYGNGVKDGAPNESAYKSTLSATTANKRRALMTFINHLGNEITDPYIYNNSGCEPADATLIWEERLGTVSNVALSADGKNLTFDIPADYIRQGNAIVAVRDASGNVMWSWYLWITDYVAGSGLQPIAADGTTGYLYPITLGRIYGGDETEFEECAATVRITQKNVPDGMTPLTAEFAVTQDASTIRTYDCYPFFQWGRKDPMIPGIESYYGPSGEIMDGTAMPVVEFGTTHLEMIETSILNPGKFVTATESDLRKISPYYCNLWDIDNLAGSPQSMQPENVKTIYDPCPVGAKVPVGNEFRALTTGSLDTTGNHVLFTASDGSIFRLSMFGYREMNGHDVMSTGTGAYWTAVSGGATRTLEFIVNSTKGSIEINDALYGFGVHPVAE